MIARQAAAEPEIEPRDLQLIGEIHEVFATGRRGLGPARLNDGANCVGSAGNVADCKPSFGGRDGGRLAHTKLIVAVQVHVDRDAGQAGFVAVLHSVAVQVFPDRSSDAPLLSASAPDVADRVVRITKQKGTTAHRADGQDVVLHVIFHIKDRRVRQIAHFGPLAWIAVRGHEGTGVGAHDQEPRP